MSDLISRGKLFNLLAPVQTLGEAYGIIQEMPTVDAVPVERKSVSGIENKTNRIDIEFTLNDGKKAIVEMTIKAEGR